MAPRPASLPDTDVVVVGAGIVGLATARAIQAIDPHLDVVVLEKEPAPARHQTGRNSGVVHSGIYYPPGSLKAQLVLDGRTLLERRCADWGVPYIECGKVLVATRDSEVDRLATLHRRAQGNGIDAQWLTSAELRRREPHVRSLAAVSVPSAAITDFGAVARSLAAEITADGGVVRTSAPVTGIAISDGAVAVTTGAPGETPAVTARWLVNCAGLHSDRVAALAGCDPAVSIVPFRGDYSTLRQSEVGLVRGLVYPVPDPRWPFLGVHFTPMVDGSVHVGPSAVLALGREAYDGGWRRSDAIDLARDRGLWRLAARYWRTGAGELLRSRSTRLVLHDARRLIPDLGPGSLEPSSSGIRAQALDRRGRLLDDFHFVDSPRCVHVLNAPSPAATASLAIGAAIADRLRRRMADGKKQNGGPGGPPFWSTPSRGR